MRDVIANTFVKSVQPQGLWAASGALNSEKSSAVGRLAHKDAVARGAGLDEDKNVVISSVIIP